MAEEDTILRKTTFVLVFFFPTISDYLDEHSKTLRSAFLLFSSTLESPGDFMHYEKDGAPPQAN